MISIGTGAPGPNPAFQCSFNPFDMNSIVVTGPNTYKYLKVQETEFVVDHSQLNNLERGIMGGDNWSSFTCHAWMQDTARLVVCTERNEILVCENSGEYYTFVEKETKLGSIRCIVPFNRGFIVGWSSGYLTTYERHDDLGSGISTYKRQRPQPIQCLPDTSVTYQLSHFPVASMVLTSTEDHLFFVTENNQLMRVNMSLDGLDERITFQYVICNFHSQAISGMDVCIRKQLVVTCSKDKTIRIWNYATRNLDMVSAMLQDETLAVAFHPSGFHVVCALVDKIAIYNVLGQEFQATSRTLQIKGCREIKFSNGGHLFACAVGLNAIYVYNFYTEDCPSYYQCKGHVNKVRSIDWWENDMGFTSCGQDGNVYFYDLIYQKEQQQRLNEKDFNQKGIILTSVVNIPGKPFEMYTVGNDKKIWWSKEPKNGFDAGVALSQIALTNNQKALIGGVGEEGRPGAVHIFQTP